MPAGTAPHTHNGEQIAIARHPAGKLAFDNFSILLPDGYAVLDEPLVEVDRGERVNIAGGTESARSELLRAVAGIGPRGSGTVLLPATQMTMLMPSRPYLPLATLRAAVSYPARSKSFDDGMISAALTRVRLDRADSDEVARAFRDDGAHGFRHDVAQGVTPRWQW
ncbi:MAG: hypothetical protein L0210_06535, partial [Rhodospirillales bacterium]|nr:hypothetical protein [Rhodospirillales bacterium]